MKYAATMVAIWAIMILIGTGCSQEEEPPLSSENAAVRKAIQMPVQEGAGDVIVSQKPDLGPAAEKESVEMVAEIEEKKPEKGPENVQEIEDGYYITQKGESLSSIAGREDIYGDPLKWTVLYRFNMEELEDIAKDENFPDVEIPERTSLKVVQKAEMDDNLRTRPENYWVINVMSSPEKEMVSPRAITLIRNGYPAYMSSVEVEGKTWIRLRVGFFEQREDAEAEGKKIMDILNSSDIWTTKVGDIERSEFGGY